MSSMVEHMDAYYLRRILRRLTDKAMDQVLPKASSAAKEEMEKCLCILSTNEETGHNLDLKCGSEDFKGNRLKQHILLHELEPHALQALHELVSQVHDSVNVADQHLPVQSASASESATSTRGDSKKIVAANLFYLEDDPVAKIFWILKPLTLQSVLLVMAHNFPRTLEALILHLLSPVGADVLTRKFDEMDQQITEEDRNKFYQVFYGVFEDQFAAMDSILKGKESFAFQAFTRVLDQYLGINLSGLKSYVG